MPMKFCFYACVNPLKSALSITKEECERIVLGASKIIKEAIEMGGTTIRSYTSSLGVTGRFQQNLKVHKRGRTVLFKLWDENYKR